MTRREAIAAGWITPERPYVPGTPSPQKWVDAPTLKMDRAGRIAAEAEIAAAYSPSHRAENDGAR